MNIAVQKTYPRKLSRNELLRTWLNQVMPEIPLQSEDYGGWSVKYRDLVFKLLEERVASYSYFNHDFTPLGISISITDENYKTITRRVMIKNDEISAPDLLKKVNELLAMQGEINKKKHALSVREELRHISLEGLKRQVTDDFDKALGFAEGIHEGTSDLYALRLTNLTVDQVLAVAQALGKVK